MEVLKLLVQRGADVNAADGEGRTALMSASSKGGLEETKYLLDSAGNVNTRDNIGVTALILAAENGHADLVNLLLDKGADLKAKDNSGWTALMCAADRGHANVVGLLKAKGDEVTLPVAALIGDRPEVEHFIEAGSDINMSVADGLTALIAAALRGNTSLVDLLLKKGADVNARAGGGPISRQKKSLVVPKGLPDSSPASRVVLTRGHVVNTMSKRLALKGSPILKIGGPRQGPHCRCIDPFRGLASRVPRDYRWVAPLGLVSVYSLSPPWEVGTIALTKLAT
jgi:ankyrin repeat protein